MYGAPGVSQRLNTLPRACGIFESFVNTIFIFHNELLCTSALNCLKAYEE